MAPTLPLLRRNEAVAASNVGEEEESAPLVAALAEADEK